MSHSITTLVQSVLLVTAFMQWCFCYSTKRIYRSVAITLFCIFHSTRRFSHKLPGSLDLDNLSLCPLISPGLIPLRVNLFYPMRSGMDAFTAATLSWQWPWCRTLHKHKVSQLARSHNGTVPKLNQWCMNRDPFPLHFVLNQHANRGPRLPQVVWPSLWSPLYWKHVLFLHLTLPAVAFRAAYLEATLCFLSYT